jgi:serine/threonine protein kinase
MMSIGQIVQGQRSLWHLLEKLGEGDAGEVFLVESTLEGKQAILKRPRKGAYSSDILRQAAQIKTEGNILMALGGISFPHHAPGQTGQASLASLTSLTTPALLDQCPPGDDFGERFFIVIQRALGFDLKTLHQIAYSGQLDEYYAALTPENRFFFERLAILREIPEPILVRALSGVLDLLETIHASEVWNESTKQYGVIWNDVKAEHLYWDLQRARMTIIDWGNGQFLEPDGTTRDRRYSCNDDFIQYLQEMGGFLADANPSLYARLDWPQDVPVSEAYSKGIKPLKKRLASLQKEASNQLKKLRTAEADLYGTTRPEGGHLAQGEELQRQIVTFGELPDFASAVNFHARLLLQMAAEKDLLNFQQVCEQTARLIGSVPEKWELLANLSGIALQQRGDEDGEIPAAFSNALAAGVADDWPLALWELAEWVGDDPLPGWWDSLSQAARRVHLRLDPQSLTPYTEVSRLFYTLQAAILQMGDRAQGASSEAGLPPEGLQARESLLKIVNDEVVRKWREIEPAPPYAGIAYDELDGFISDIETVLPGTQDRLEKILTQPKAQARIVLDAWERKEFELARRALRRLLIWDPDRRRLLLADRALASTPQWLARVRQGAGTDEPFYDYLTAVELAGRRLRDQVGPASWIDSILDTFKSLRKGARHADLLMEHPLILIEIPWLSEYRSREILTLPASRPLTLERDQTVSRLASAVSGMVEGKLGAGQDVHLQEPQDTWAPEARGSSARVFAGTLRTRASQNMPYAIKVMRPGSLEYALPLFRDEAQILTLLGDLPGITPLVECGFLLLEDGGTLPSEEGHVSAEHLRGQVARYGVEEVQNYLASMERFISQGWLPYLALEMRDQEHNLMRYCDAGRTHGWFLPLKESLLLAIQSCDILQGAHDRNIVYRDHKILHYYWDPTTHGVVMIDWNIAKRQPQGLSETERQFDVVQFGARALHHILTGRPAPGALPLGPNRPEDIESSAMSYAVSWTYDDERLPNRVKEILEQTLNQGYSHFRDLRQDLARLYQQMSGEQAN